METGTDAHYRPPESQLEDPTSSGSSGGSIELALNGDFEFEIKEIISEAWALVKNSKGVIVFGVLLALAVSFGTNVIVGEYLPPVDESAPFLLTLAYTFSASQLGASLATPISAGVLLFSIQRAANDPTASFGTILRTLGLALPIIAANVLYFSLIMVGYVLLVIPGIYLGIAYVFAVPLIVEKQMGIWEALETSRRAVTRCWFRVFGLMVSVGLIAGFGGLLTLGIGFIWLIPLNMLSLGVLYYRMFGYEGDVA